jgi:uncharacterized protein YciI
MQFYLHALDYTDDEALARRLAVRPAHFDGVRQLKAEGHFILGGAILDEAGKMIGSMAVVDFADEAELRARWLAVEPYVTGRVWERIEIRPFRVADV